MINSVPDTIFAELKTGNRSSRIALYRATKINKACLCEERKESDAEHDGDGNI